MLPTVIKSCPSAENDFEPLSEYQAQTPQTFFDGKAILYFHDEHIKAWCSEEQYQRLFFFTGADSAAKNPTPPESHTLENEGGKHLREEANVHVFVASSKFILFSPASGTGIEIPYPAITLHAVKNFKHLGSSEGSDLKFVGVYMQLEFSGDGGEDDDSFDPIELTLIPSSTSSTTADSTIDPLNAERTSALYDQISSCQNLHPDPADEDDEDDEDTDRIVFEGEALEGLPGAFQGDTDGGLPPPMPGSSGWITADNVHEYFDADGNWIGGEEAEAEEEEGVSGELGEGAGRVRIRDEMDGNDANGEAAEENGDPKRPRTE